MSGPAPAPSPGGGLPGSDSPGGDSLVDGEWHRLHPLTPLLRGGIVLIAIIGILIANFRDRFVELFLGDLVGSEYEGGAPPDLLSLLVERELVLVFLLAVIGLLAVLVLFGLLSWRMHSFRIGEDAVEERRGILFRSHRQARLDRIQGVNVQRPLVARLFGLAKLQVTTAGQDANIDLAYLRTAQIERLRGDVLSIAGGLRRAAGRADGPGVPPDQPASPGAVAPAAPVAAPARRDLLGSRVDDFLAPELDPAAAPPESVVRIPLGRLVGSILLGPAMVALVVWTALFVVLMALGVGWALLIYVPLLLSLGGLSVSRLVKSLRYSIAGTPAGVRVGFGLFSIVNDTIPHRRIHAVEVRQPLLWRPFGWWLIRINKAGLALATAAQASTNTLLPVGDARDVQRVLAVLLPDADPARLESIAEEGMRGRSAGVFRTLPRRAAVLRPFTWRRNGIARLDDLVLLRDGILSRSLAVFPLARLQGVGLRQGPLDRALGLVSLQLHVVAGPVHTWLTGSDRRTATQEWRELSADLVTAVAAEAAAPGPASPRGEPGRGEAP